MRYVVTQLGARMHYAVPSALAKADMLGVFYTDFVCPSWLSTALNLLPAPFLPDGLKRMAGRIPPGMPSTLVEGFQTFGFQYLRKRKSDRSASDRTRTYLWAGETFGSRVIQRGFGDAKAVYGFNSASLEIFKAAKKLGLKCVLEQTIAPKYIEDKLNRDEQKRWPGWENPQERDVYLEEFVRREEEEWKLADQILCGSNFVKECIRKAGGPYQKCKVVPYGVGRVPERSVPSRAGKEGPLRILTVGAVNLRKGAPWVNQLSKSLKEKAVFRWVGPVQITEEAKKRMATTVELTGPVPHQDIDRHYEWADVLLLQSVCEGSATVIYEALVRGIPVICTKNSGPPAFRAQGLYVLPAQNFQAAKRKIAELVRMKRNGKTLCVSPELMSFASFGAYEKRLLRELARKQ